MRRLAISASWAVLCMNLYGILAFDRARAVGFFAMVPFLLLGTTLVVHHSSRVHPGAIWTALILNAVWGLLGIVGVALMIVAGQSDVKLGLFVAFITLGPAVPNVLSLNVRRVQAARPQVAS